MSGVANAKQGMGWISPQQRAGCGNCSQVKTELAKNGTSNQLFFCSKAGFYTNRFAICDEYIPMMLTGGTQP